MAIRLATPNEPAHFEAWKDILWRVSELAMDVDEIEHFLATDRESRWTLAFLDESPAGLGVGRPSSVAGANFAMVRVLPACRTRGVGTALLGSLSEHAHSAGRDQLWGRIRADDAASLAFASNRGFREIGRERDVVLDVSSAPIGVAHVEGIEFTTLAERPDLVQAVYELDVEVSPDVPSHGDSEVMTFERWHAGNLEGPGAMPEAYIVALDSGDVVGYTALRRRGADAAEAENLLTAVRRDWRRQGIASALKQRQIALARTAGIEQIFTTNDEANVGMRGVNARLGYKPLPEIVVVSGPA
jgi:GNAT superfamily N-acetyltransferase